MNVAADSTYPQSPILRSQRLPDIERARVRLTFKFVKVPYEATVLFNVDFTPRGWGGHESFFGVLVECLGN
jgi:hypothetical protein